MSPSQDANYPETDSDAAVLLDELNRVFVAEPLADLESLKLQPDSWRRRFRILREQCRKVKSTNEQMDREMCAVQQELQARSTVIVDLHTQIAALRSEMLQLKSSRSWRMLHRTRKTLGRIRRGVARRLQFATQLVRGR